MCRSDDALYRSTVLPGVLKADQRSHNEKYVNWNEAAIRELLTIRAEAEIILQFSEMVSAHYTRHMKGHVSLRDLYGLCVNACTYSGKSLAVWMQQIWRSGNKCRNTLPVYFPESLCERGSNVFRWKKQTHLHIGWPEGEYIFLSFWVNFSLNKQPWSKVLTSVKHLNSANLWFKARWNKTDKCEKHCAQLYSQKAFQFTNCHHLPWIYCSNTNCTIVFWQKCGIFIPKLYYII